MQQQASVLRYRTSALRRVTWAIWPWLNWLLPIGFCLAALGTGRGVLPMLAVFASPLLVPAAGLLGALPRRMLRSQGVGAATPASITWLLVLHWWSWIGMAVTLPDDTFVEVRPSLLQRLLGQPLSETFWTGVFVGSVVLVLGSWTATLIIVANPPAPRHLRRWNRAAWATVAVAPMLLLLCGPIGIGVAQIQTDAAGDRPAQVDGQSAADQIIRAQQRYDEAQRVVSALRVIAAADRWDADDAEAEALNADGRGSKSYRLRISFSHQATPDLAIDHDAFAAVLTAADWTITRSGQSPLRIDARDAHGSSLTMAQQGDTPLQITVTTGSWWQSADLPVTAELGRAGGIGGGYAGDEWPLLR